MRGRIILLAILALVPVSTRAERERYVAWPGNCPGAKARVPRGCYVRRFEDRIEIHCRSGVQVLRPCVRKAETLAVRR